MSTRHRHRLQVPIEQPPPEPASPAPQTGGVDEARFKRYVRAFYSAVVVVALLIAYNGYRNFVQDRDIREANEYLAQAKPLRDEQNQAVNERLDARTCAILDRFPAGPLLDPLREEWGCGPGIDPDSLDPAAVQRLLEQYGPAALSRTPDEFYDLFPMTNGQAPRQSTTPPRPQGTGSQTSREPTPAPPQSTASAPSPTGAATAAPATTSTPPPAAASPSSSSAAPPPLVDLRPITDPLCSVLGVCA